MRKALIVGINYYKHGNNLHGCANDAKAMERVLDKHGDGTFNFDVSRMVARSEASAITREELKESVLSFFSEKEDLALFYFSGHGYVESTGGYLITSECKRGDAGFSMYDLLSIANASPVLNKIIILDCCHSGYFGETTLSENVSHISEGLTVLSASAKNQVALESNGSGLFTALLLDALKGGGANITGDITPGSVYAYIDQSLGLFGQRPLFKTNIKRFTVLRKVTPPISLEDLRAITDLFKNNKDHDDKGGFRLDPTYEETEPTAIKKNVEKFKILQKLEGVNLVVPIGEDHMYWAAINSKGCRLTKLGQHYWRLIRENRI